MPGRSSTPLGRTRTIAFLAASAVLSAHTIPVLLSRAGPGWTAASVGAIAALLGVLVWTRFRATAVPLEPVLTPALLVVTGASFGGPVRTMTITIAVYAVLALYGSQRAWVLRTLLGLAVLPAAAALGQPAGSGSPVWHSADVLGLVPFVVPVGLVMRNIHRVLIKQQQVSARDALLSSAGGRLLAAGSVEEVHRIGIELTGRLIDLAPGLAVIIVRPAAGGARVGRSIGLDVDLEGRPVPAGGLADPAAVFGDADPGLRHWHVEQLADRYLVLGARRPIAEDEVDAYRNLVHQVTLGELNVRTRAELTHRAHHDYLTQLANRDLFFATLEVALERDPAGSVALLTVDLDGFKQINDTYGHDAGDRVLVEVAARLRATAGPGWLAARLGGDEFAMVLTGLTREGEAQEVGRALRDRVAVPVAWGRGTVRVGASIGIATGTPGITPADLVRRADLAMYEAKRAAVQAMS